MYHSVVDLARQTETLTQHAKLNLMSYTIILSDCLKHLTYLDIASLYMSVVRQNIVPHNCILSTFKPTANIIVANVRKIK